MSKNILITGGCGFVGSNLAVLLKEKYPAYQITALDNLSRKGSELNIPRLEEYEIKFRRGDVRYPADLATESKLDLIIDAAAEPSVMAGIDSSLDYLVQTNFNGTVNTTRDPIVQFPLPGDYTIKYSTVIHGVRDTVIWIIQIH